jgi:hypothetical protein
MMLNLTHTGRRALPLYPKVADLDTLEIGRIRFECCGYDGAGFDPVGRHQRHPDTKIDGTRIRESLVDCPLHATGRSGMFDICQ